MILTFCISNKKKSSHITLLNLNEAKASIFIIKLFLDQIHHDMKNSKKIEFKVKNDDTGTNHGEVPYIE